MEDKIIHKVICVDISGGQRPREVPMKIRLCGIFLVCFTGMVSLCHKTNFALPVEYTTYVSNMALKVEHMGYKILRYRETDLFSLIGA